MNITTIDVIKAPALRKLPKRDHWEYAEDWSCAIYTRDEGVINIRIKKGYWTDLASVPRPLRGTFDNGSGEFGVLIASQVHDMMYATHWTSKDFADALFYDILRRYGMNRVKAWCYYKAVSWFGDSAWDVLSDEEMEKDRKLCSYKWLDYKLYYDGYNKEETYDQF